METMKIRTIIKENWITETGKVLKVTNYIRGRIAGVHDMFDASEIKHAFAIDEKNNRVLNSEGLELGDELTIVGMADKLDSFNDNLYAVVNVTGARDSISLGRLVGSPKEKYFAKGRENTESIDYDSAKVLKLPRRIADAMLAIQAMKGKTIRLVAIANECGRDADRTYYRFVEV